MLQYFSSHPWELGPGKEAKVTFPLLIWIQKCAAFLWKLLSIIVLFKNSFSTVSNLFIYYTGYFLFVTIFQLETILFLICSIHYLYFPGVQRVIALYFFLAWCPSSTWELKNRARFLTLRLAFGTKIILLPTCDRTGLGSILLSLMHFQLTRSRVKFSTNTFCYLFYMIIVELSCRQYWQQRFYFPTSTCPPIGQIKFKF